MRRYVERRAARRRAVPEDQTTLVSPSRST
jgi:hypothetical protein